MTMDFPNKSNSDYEKMIKMISFDFQSDLFKISVYDFFEKYIVIRISSRFNIDNSFFLLTYCNAFDQRNQVYRRHSQVQQKAVKNDRCINIEEIMSVSVDIIYL